MIDKPMINRSAEIIHGAMIGASLGDLTPNPNGRPLGEFITTDEMYQYGIPICQIGRPVRRLRGRLHPRRQYVRWGINKFGIEGPYCPAPTTTESIHRHGLVSFREVDCDRGKSAHWYAAHRGYLAAFNLCFNAHQAQHVPYLFVVTIRFRVFPDSVINASSVYPRQGTNVVSFHTTLPSWSQGMPVWNSADPNVFRIPVLVAFQEADAAYNKKEWIDSINNRNMVPLSLHGCGFVISDAELTYDSSGQVTRANTWYARFKPYRINPAGLTITRFQGTPHEITVPKTLLCIGTSFDSSGTPTSNAPAMVGYVDHLPTVLRCDTCMIYKPLHLDPLNHTNYNALKPQWMDGLFDLDHDPISDYLGECIARRLLIYVFNILLPNDLNDSKLRYYDPSKIPQDILPYRTDAGTWENREWLEMSYTPSYPHIMNPATWERAAFPMADPDHRRNWTIDLTRYLAFKPTRLADQTPMFVIRNDRKEAFRHAWNRRIGHMMHDNAQFNLPIGNVGYGTIPVEYPILQQILNVDSNGNPVANNNNTRDFQQRFNMSLYLLGMTRTIRALRRWIRKLIVDEDGNPVLTDSDIRIGANTYTTYYSQWLVFAEGMDGRIWDPSRNLYIWSPGDHSTNAAALDLPPLTPATNDAQGRANLCARWRNWVSNYQRWATYQFLLHHDEITSESYLFHYYGEDAYTMGQPIGRELALMIKHLCAQNRQSIHFWNDVVAILHSSWVWRMTETVLRLGKRVTIRSNFMSNNFRMGNADLSWHIEGQLRAARYRDAFLWLISQIPDDVLLPGILFNYLGQPLFPLIHQSRPAGGVYYGGVYYPPIRQLIRVGIHPGPSTVQLEQNRAQNIYSCGLWFAKNKAYFEAENANGRPFAFWHPFYEFADDYLNKRRVRLASRPIA